MIAPVSGTLTLLLAATTGAALGGRMFLQFNYEFQESNHDPLQTALLNGRMPLGCPPGLLGILRRKEGGTVYIL